MLGISPSQTLVEFRRAMQVMRVMVDFSLFIFLSKLYRPRGLRKRTLWRRIYTEILRLSLGQERPHKKLPVKLRETLEYLGPTYVKLGQILSLREDMLPERITRELRKLQTKVPPFPFVQVKRVVESDFNRPLNVIFEYFDETPIASASLAQAHVAYLRGGIKVAVKVQRPGIVKLILHDLNILRRTGAVLEYIPLIRDYQPTKLIREFGEYTIRELDFVQEGKHADIFRENFKNEPKLLVPKIYWDYTSKRVLTMQFIDGIEPDDYKKVQSFGINGEKLAKLGTKFVMKMLYEDGFFHGDPHPGNLLIVGRDRLALLDMGMVGVFSKNTMKNLFLYFYFLVLGEYDHASKYLLELCSYGPGSDPEGFRKEISNIGRNWSGQGFMNYSLGKLILNSMNKGARYKLFFSSDLMLGVKAVITIEAVGHILYPEMNLSEVARPIMTEMFLKKFSPAALLKPLANALPDYMDALTKMPQDILRAANLLSDGKFQIELTAPDNQEDDTANLQLWLPRIGAAALLTGVGLTLYQGTPGPLIHFEPLTGMPLLGLLSFALSGLLFLKTWLGSRDSKRIYNKGH